jgi:2-polyprenyl-6-methoxyphenol hydroxylase-like FAD-dependent oxidoreductase
MEAEVTGLIEDAGRIAGVRARRLCIGDAAHAMFPVGGVGVNLAIQDAVAAAGLLTPALLGGASPRDTSPGSSAGAGVPRA